MKYFNKYVSLWNIFDTYLQHKFSNIGGIGSELYRKHVSVSNEIIPFVFGSCSIPIRIGLLTLSLFQSLAGVDLIKAPVNVEVKKKQPKSAKKWLKHSRLVIRFDLLNPVGKLEMIVLILAMSLRNKQMEQRLFSRNIKSH